MQKLQKVIRRTDPMIIIVSFLYLFMRRTYADSYGLSVKIRCRPLLIIVTGGQARCDEWRYLRLIGAEHSNLLVEHVNNLL